SYIPALCLSLLLGVTAVASAKDVVIDFNDTKNTTANTQMLSSAPNGAVTNTNIGGRNAVQTGGTTDNEFLYIPLPKDASKEAKALWAVVEYYDQGTDKFTLSYDSSGTETKVTENPVTKHDTKAWLKHVFTLPGAAFTEGLDGADLKLDDLADGAEVIDQITV